MIYHSLYPKNSFKVDGRELSRGKNARSFRLGASCYELCKAFPYIAIFFFTKKYKKLNIQKKKQEKIRKTKIKLRKKKRKKRITKKKQTKNWKRQEKDKKKKKENQEEKKRDKN